MTSWDCFMLNTIQAQQMQIVSCYISKECFSQEILICVLVASPEMYNQFLCLGLGWAGNIFFARNIILNSDQLRPVFPSRQYQTVWKHKKTGRRISTRTKRGCEGHPGAHKEANKRNTVGASKGSKDFQLIPNFQETPELSQNSCTNHELDAS